MFNLALSVGGPLVAIGVSWGVVKTMLASHEKRMDKVEADAKQTADDLNEFKLKAAETFVSSRELAKIEGQMQAGFDAIRQELRDTNQTIVAAILNQKPPATSQVSR